MPPKDDTPAPAPLLLRGCFFIQPSADVDGLRGQDILIEGGLIAKVGREIPAPRDARVVDCSRHVVVPGFVNTHHHFFQTLTRNLPAVQNAKLFDWLVYLYEVWKNIDEEAIYTSSLLAMGELLKTGCTCSTDHLYLYPRGAGDFVSRQFEAAEKLGMRFSPSRGSMSLSRKDGGLPPDSVVQDADTILADSERVIRRFHDPAPLAMRKVVLAPCSPFSVTESLMRETARLARRYNVRLHTHLAETEDENDYCAERYGVRPVALMERCEFIGPEVFYAHGIFFNDDELKVLRQAGAHVAHCPSSNMRLASGICRVRDMLDMGIPVALAVDGSASNDSSDFLGELRHALLLQRVARGSSALTAREVLRMATEGGAGALGFQRLGRIEPGFAADLAVFDVDRLEYAGSLSDPFAALIFAGYNHGTDYTICNGRVVVEKGRLTGVDEHTLTREANRIAEGLLRAAAGGG
ncbi:MAG TPA: 8-oxoguanine deaminase [Spirochaetia bacterium]|nr:8-oxoguanine deaminase [Spirochaetia bacterium]